MITALEEKNQKMNFSMQSQNQDRQIQKAKKSALVPIQEKALLSLEEAAAYTGIGLQKLRDISNTENCDFVLWNGSRRMFKRKRLEDYLYKVFSI